MGAASSKQPPTAHVVKNNPERIDQLRLIAYKNSLALTFSIAMACFLLLAIDVTFALVLQQYCAGLETNPLNVSYSSTTVTTPSGGYYGGAWPDIVAVCTAGWPKICDVNGGATFDKEQCGIATDDGVAALVRWQMIWIIIIGLGVICFALFLQYRSSYYEVLHMRYASKASTADPSAT